MTRTPFKYTKTYLNDLETRNKGTGIAKFGQSKVLWQHSWDGCLRLQNNLVTASASALRDDAQRARTSETTGGHVDREELGELLLRVSLREQPLDGVLEREVEGLEQFFSTFAQSSSRNL